MKKVLYFADPMCSWCYGFTSVIEQIREHYGRDLEIEIIAGGYSPGNTEVITNEYKDFLHRAWTSVKARTGADFDFDMKFAGENFRYDTEPSSRALAVIQDLKPDLQFSFFQRMQTAFYAEGRDITREAVLADIAEEHGLGRQVFLEAFGSDRIRNATQEGFVKSRQMGIRGFPSLVGAGQTEARLLARGYRPFESLKSELEEWLES